MTEEEGRLEMEAINKEIEAYENRPVLEKIKDSVSDLVNDVSEFVNNIKESLGSEKEKEVSNDAFEKLLEQKEESFESTTIKSQGMTTEENVSIEDYNIENSREVVSENEATSKEEVSTENDLMSKSYNDIKENYQEEFNNTSDEFKVDYMKTLDDELSMLKAYGENLEDSKDSVYENGFEHYKDEIQQNFNDAIDDINEVYKGSSEEIINGEIQKEEQNFNSESALHSEEISNKISEIDNDIESNKNNISSIENQLESFKEDYKDIAETYEKNKENETTSKEEVSSENVSNNETQEQKSEENSSLYDSLSSYMSENIDLMADSRESEIAFDRGLAEALDNLDKKDFNSLSDVINDVKEKLENENDRASDKLFEQEATSEKVVEGNKDDLAEFGNAVQDFKDLTNSEEAQAYKEEQLSPENTKAGELFEKRDELMEQLENPKDGTFEIEQQLESINEKISELSTDDLRDYNNSLSSEITQEMRTEQEAIQERSELGQKDNDLAEFGNAVQDFKDLTNSEEAQAYKEEVLTSENNNEIKTEISNDVESSADNLKMELAKEEFTSYAEQNLPENEREEFVNTMLDISADSIKSQETVEGVEKEINSSLESYQEVKAELEAEKNVDVSSETNLKQDVEIDKNVDSSSVNEKEVSSDLQSKDVPEAVSDKETSKEVEAEKNIDSNVNSDKEQQKQTEIDFATETGASR